jgi:SAM-dependent methyltransferase
MNDHALRETFDASAESYDGARPDYPSELFDHLIDVAGLRSEDRLLEIGCGTGKATRPLAERGFHIVALELGENLARVAQRNLADYPNVGVVNSSFEDWDSREAVFDLIYAATSWHWIDQSIRYSKAASLLRPGGTLAFWSATHAFPEAFDPFFTEIQEVYDKIGESHDGDVWPPRPPEEIEDDSEEIRTTGMFREVVVRRYVWEITYNAEEYIRLLDTFSSHIAMPPEKRDTLYQEIRQRIARRPHQQIRRHWHYILHVARRT